MGDGLIIDPDGFIPVTASDLEGIEQEAAASCDLAGTFVHEFSEFLLRNRMYAKLGLSDGHAVPLAGMTDHAGFVALIRDMQERPVRNATYQFCAMEEERQQARANILLEWRLDLQYPAAMELWLPYRDEPLNFFPLKQKPHNRRALDRLLAMKRPKNVRPEVRNGGDVILVHSKVRNAAGPRDFRRQFNYLGQFGDEQEYHLYGSTPRQDSMTQVSGLASILEILKP